MSIDVIFKIWILESRWLYTVDSVLQVRKSH